MNLVSRDSGIYSKCADTSSLPKKISLKKGKGTVNSESISTEEYNYILLRILNRKRVNVKKNDRLLFVYPACICPDIDVASILVYNF